MNSVLNSIIDAEAIQSDWVGRVIDGRFTLLQWLGGSGRSSVFLTELPGPQARKAAIKLIQTTAGTRKLLWLVGRRLAPFHILT